VKVVLAAVAVLLVILGLLVGALFVVDLSVFKPQVERLVGRIVGRELVIAGTFQPTFGRYTSLIVERASFADAPWAEDGDMVRLERGEITVDLLSFIDGPVQVTRLVLRGAEIRLERNVDGVGNWQLGGDSAADGGLPQIFLQRGDVENLSLRYATPDRVAPLKVTVERFTQRLGENDALHLTGTGAVGSRSFTVDGHLSALPVILSGRNVEHELHVSMDGLALDAKGSIGDVTRLSGVDTHLSIKGPDAAVLAELMGQPDTLTGPFHVEGRLSDAKPGVQVNLTGEAAVGSLAVQGVVRDPLEADGINVTAQIQGGDLAVFGRLLGQELPDGPFELHGGVEHQGGHLKVDDLVLAAGGAHLTGSSSFPQFPDLAGGQAAAKLTGDDLARFATTVGLPDLPRQPFSAAVDMARADGIDRIEAWVKVGEDELRVAGPLGGAPDYEDSKLEWAVSGPDLGRVSRELGGPLLPAAPYEGSAVLQRTPAGFTFSGLNVKAGNLRASGRGAYGPAGQLDLTFSLSGPDLDAFVALINDVDLPAQAFQANGRLKFADQTLTLDDVAFSSDGGHLALDGNIQLVKGYVGSNLSVDADLKDLGSLLPSGASFVPRPDRFRANGRLARKNAQVVEVDNLKVTLGDDWLSVDGELNDTGSAILQIEAETKSLAGVGRWKGSELPDLPLALTATLQGEATSASFKTLTLRSGQTSLQGHGELALDPRVRLALTLESDRVDLDALLGAQTDEVDDDSEPSSAKARLIPDTPLPMDLLRTLDAEVDAKFASVLVLREEARDVSFKMRLEGGRFEVDPLIFTGLSGQVRSSGVLEPVADGGRVSLELHANDVQLGLMADEGQVMEGRRRRSHGTASGEVVTGRRVGDGRRRADIRRCRSPAYG
jgi:uncharacterized protein involved in outer membrane biogenesis